MKPKYPHAGPWKIREITKIIGHRSFYGGGDERLLLLSCRHQKWAGWGHSWVGGKTRCYKCGSDKTNDLQSPTHTS